MYYWKSKINALDWKKWKYHSYKQSVQTNITIQEPIIIQIPHVMMHFELLFTVKNRRCCSRQADCSQDVCGVCIVLSPQQNNAVCALYTATRGFMKGSYTSLCKGKNNMKEYFIEYPWEDKLLLLFKSQSYVLSWSHTYYTPKITKTTMCPKFAQTGSRIKYSLWWNVLLL